MRRQRCRLGCQRGLPEDDREAARLNKLAADKGDAVTKGSYLKTRSCAAATNVQELVIPDSGHWLMEEQPAATVPAVRAFLERR